MVRNTYIYPPEPSMRIISDIFGYTSARCRSSTASRSPAITCRKPARRRSRSSPSPSPTACEYVKYGVASGLDIDKFAGRLSFFFAIGMNFFMEIAKLRAARVLWHRVMTDLGAQGRALARCCARIARLSGVSLHRAGPVQQRHPHHDRGDGGDAGRHAVAPHQRARRGDRAADRFLRPDRAQHADRACRKRPG